MKISKAGIDLIKSFEACKLKAYPDPGTGGAPWTIGWGHTGGVEPGDTCTQAEADGWLMLDLAVHERCVNDVVQAPISQGAFDALVSFAYNCGDGNLRGSTLLKMLNKGDVAGASKQFERWSNANGKPLAGLLRRRKAEAAMFIGGANV